MKFTSLVLVIILIFSYDLFSDVRYVSPAGNNTPPFLSWETAAHRIQSCIDISDNGDTIYVGNGVYHDSVRIDKQITLSGVSTDSVIIDGTGLANVTVYITAPATIKNFTIYAKANGVGYGIYPTQTAHISSCKIYYGTLGIALFCYSSKVENIFLLYNFKGISSVCYGSGCTDTISSCVIINNSQFGIGLSLHDGAYLIHNNIIFYTGEYSDPGIYISDLYGIKLYNNIISGFQRNIYFETTLDTSFFYNNFIGYKKTTTLSESSIHSFADYLVMKNNIFSYNNDYVINCYPPSYIQEDYNLFWRNAHDKYQGVYGDSDIVNRDPMFIKDTQPNVNLDFDYHLQKYSPCIDKGDPSILDKDGTRSDLGIYGGEYGEEYTYQDYAPASPKNLTAIVDTSGIKLKWNKNTEADTAYYSVYLDSVANFQIDSTKLIAKLSDTSYTYIHPQVNKHYYFKITATDIEGHQSIPSEEIHILITITGEQYPKIISDYRLYQNYPNPFNPSTTIGYRLKESGYVKLLVYDIKGEVVKVLVNKQQEAGYYEQEFDATGLASGIYLYRLEVIGKGNIPVFSDMKKTILLK